MQDKKTLITIVVLLIIFIPLSIIGSINHFCNVGKENKLIDDNPNKEFIYNNHLYFYNEDKLIGIYECSNCKTFKNKIDDGDYHINAYLEGDKEYGPILNNNWAIFMKQDEYVLYNLMSNKPVDVTYEQVKFYKTEMENLAMIYKMNGYWGVTFLDNPGLGINANDNNYEFLGLPGHFKNGLLDTSKFIAKKGNLWHLLNKDGTGISPINREIVDYSDKYYILYDEDTYKIVDFNEVEFLEYMDKKKVYGTSKYIIVLNSSNMLYFYEDCSANVLKFVQIPEFKNLYFNETDKGIDIMIDGNLFETVVI